MKNSIKLLWTIFGIGLSVSIIRLLSGGGGSGIGNFVDTIHYMSIILFSITLFVLILDFKQLKSSISIWVFIIISSPFTFLYLYNMGFDKVVETTTPSEFKINTLSGHQYSYDSLKLTQLVDSLIQVR